MSNLPAKQAQATITKLFEGSLIDFVPLEQLNVILNTPPPAAWIAHHPYIKKVVNGQKVKVPFEYLPIDKVEYLLRKCFKRYRIEVLKTAQLFNSIECHVRVHYLNPATGEMDFHDGVGAKELQTQSGSGSLKLDMSNVNKSAVEMALPIAKTTAIKDACDHFGELFGCNLNRDGHIVYMGDESAMYTPEQIQALLAEKADKVTPELKANATRIIEGKEVASYGKLWRALSEL